MRVEASFRHGLYLDRFQYWPPWGCTFWYRPSFFRGSDEFCNASIGIGLALLGTFIFFKPWGKRRNHDDGMCIPCVKEISAEDGDRFKLCAHGWPETCEQWCNDKCHPR